MEFPSQDEVRRSLSVRQILFGGVLLLLAVYSYVVPNLVAKELTEVISNECGKLAPVKEMPKGRFHKH